MSAPAAEEATMLQRFRDARGGDRDAAFENIFQVHRDRAFAVTLRVCGNRALAEDALQETFLEVFKGLSAFRGESQLGTWIYRLAVRRALRVRARHPVPKDAKVESTPGSTDPNAVLSAREDARAVQAALAALPEEQRVVVCLFSDQGLSHTEIATILAIPEGTVWSRLHKARKTLAAALK